MMTQVIYTYGGGEILWKILNILSMIFKSNSTYFTPLLKVTLAIGALWAGMRAILQANVGLFAKSWFFPAYIILSLLLVPKVSVHIIDRVDSSMHYAKVDNIPFGLSCIASLTSQVTDTIATFVDSIIAPNDSEKYTVVGPVFGARLAKAAHDITIKDPIMKQNIKEFVSRCYMWPFIFTNMNPGRLEALQSHDILSFIEKNPHPWLGMYWRDVSGETTFMKCAACAVKVKKLMKIEVPKGLSQLAHEVFGASYSPSDSNERDKEPEQYESRINSKLSAHFPNAWQHIAHSSEQLSKVVEQEMMINGCRENLDDNREKFGLNRLDPHLLAYSAERIRAQQNSSFFLKAVLFGRHVPTIQTVFSALIFMLFIIVAPCLFLPGGFKLLAMWGKLTLWVNSWPLFYSIVNGLGHLFMIKAAGGIQMSYGAGLTLLTQGGIAEVAYDAYAFTMGLHLSVPFISWAFISSSGYAMTQLASSMTQSLESHASRLGSDMTDGNLSVDNQNLHTRALSTSQIAQQSLGANHNFARMVNDGAMQLTYGDQGRVSGQAYMSQLASNISSQDNWAATASDSYQQSTQMAASSMLSLAQKMAKGQGISQNFNEQEGADIRHSAEKFLKSTHDYAKQHNISQQTAADIALKAGGGFMISASGGLSAGASDHESHQKSLNSGTGQQMVNNASSLLNYSRQYGASLNDSSARETAESLNRQVTTSQNWQKLAQFATTNSLSIGRNENDQTLQMIADTHFNGDKTQALHFANQSPQAFEKEAAGYLSHRQEALKGFVSQATHVLSQNEIQDFMKEPLNLSKSTHQESALFDQKFESQKNRVDQGFEQTIAKSAGSLATLTENFQQRQKDFHRQELKGNLINMAEKGGGDALTPSIVKALKLSNSLSSNESIQNGVTDNSSAFHLKQQMTKTNENLEDLSRLIEKQHKETTHRTFEDLGSKKSKNK